MGVVYAATDESTQQRVAIKQLLPGMATQKRVVMLFEMEYHTLAQLSHPRIIQVFQYGLDQGIPYYTMELLEGRDLRELAPIPYQQACNYLRQVASSLALLHTRRLLHRDLSPRNVRLSSEGHCKLLDFGAMCQFGVPGAVAGTAPFVSPESLHGMSLDHRSDLYAFGALAYYVLTRKHAYPAYALDDLPAMWAAPPPRPSSRVPDIPEALDTLVMSLLSLDPMARPSCAAEVIERLTVIAGLEPPDTHEVVKSYFLNSTLIGQTKALTQLDAQISRMSQEEGGAVIVSGTAGLGRTRILNELSLRGQTAGLAPVRVDVPRYAGPLSVAAALANALRAALPAEAEAALRPYRLDLEPFLNTGDTLGSIPPASGKEPGGEVRARLQTALAEWFLDVSQSRPLLLLVDNYHHADEFSAAFLASLCIQARHNPLMLVLTKQSGKDGSKSDGARVIEATAQRVRLSPLNADETAALVASLFGQVPNVDRLSGFLHRQSGGNPGLCIELASYLVEEGHIRYVGGTWLLPQEDCDETLARKHSHTLEDRLTSLSHDARVLIEICGIRRGNMQLDVWIKAAQLDDRHFFLALDELFRSGMVVRSGDDFMFANESMRKTVLEVLEEDQRKTLHLRLADALSAGEPSAPETELDVGWHLVHGGESIRGAELLAKFAPRLAREGIAMDAAIPALEKALEIFKREGRAPADVLRLKAALVGASYMFDYRLADKYGKKTLDALHRMLCLDIADRLRPYLGAPISIAVGLLISVLRNRLRPRRRRGPRLVAALTYYTTSLISLLGLRVTALDPLGTRELEPYVDSLEGLAGRNAAGAVYLACRAVALQPMGREYEVAKAVKEALALFRQGSLPGLRENDRQDLVTGLLASGAVAECFREHSSALEMAAELEATGTRLGYAAALRTRMTHHMLRGDWEQSESLRAKLETHAIQGGTTWQVDWYAAPFEAVAAVMARDIVGIKRIIDVLERLVKVQPSLQPFLDSARMGYLHRSGDLEGARQLGERWIAQHPPKSIVGWAVIHGASALVLNDLGQYARAKEVCELALSALQDEEFAYVWANSWLENALMWSEAGLGNVAVAMEMRERLLKRRAPDDNPIIMFELHHVSARVALVSRQVELFLESLKQMTHFSQAARSPGMVAHCEQVAKMGEEIGVRSSVPPAVEDVEADAPSTAAESTDAAVTAFLPGGPGAALTAILKRCEGPRQRARQALRFLADKTQSKTAYLYLNRPEGVVLAAELPKVVPRYTLEQRVLRLMEATSTPQSSKLDTTTDLVSVITEDRELRYRIQLLTIRQANRNAVIGAVALSIQDDKEGDLSRVLLNAVARQLYAAGDAIPINT